MITITITMMMLMMMMLMMTMMMMMQKGNSEVKRQTPFLPRFVLVVTCAHINMCVGSCTSSNEK